MPDVVQDFYNKHNLPGLSISIARNDEIVYRGVFGVADRESAEPARVESRFRIASISKPITAVAILLLVQDGKLNLSDRVFGSCSILGTVPPSALGQPHLEEVTVEHLLAHTSGGWLNDDNDPMFLHSEMNHAELIEWTLANQPLKHIPGSHYAYSNFGYCMLGRIIEKVTSESYSDAVHRLVLDRCGVQNMSIAGNRRADRQADEVVYYSDEDDPYEPNVARMDSHGGWIASATDLVRFAVRVNGFPQEPDILSEASIRTMTTPSTANGGYALGWAVNEKGSWWHGGSLAGTATIMVRTAGGLCWAALTNTRTPGLGAELDKVMWAAAAELGLIDAPTIELGPRSA